MSSNLRTIFFSIRLDNNNFFALFTTDTSLCFGHDCNYNSFASGAVGRKFLPTQKVNDTQGYEMLSNHNPVRNR